jgi:hypothetical protein
MKSVGIQLRFLTTYKMSFGIQKYTYFNGYFGGVNFNGFCGTFLLKNTHTSFFQQSHIKPQDFFNSLQYFFSSGTHLFSLTSHSFLGGGDNHGHAPLHCYMLISQFFYHSSSSP